MKTDEIVQDTIQDYRKPRGYLKVVNITIYIGFSILTIFLFFIIFGMPIFLLVLKH